MSTDRGSSSTAVAALWRLTARTFAAEIDPPFYRALLAISTRSDDPRMALIGPATRAREEGEVLDELAIEYCRLFIGPHAVCPPYASVQCGEACLGGQALRRLMDLMARHGLSAAPPPGMPVVSEDHIAVALALLDRLCTTGQMETARELRETWLLPWAPHFLTSVREQSPHTPYGAVAHLASNLLLDDELLRGDREVRPPGLSS